MATAVDLPHHMSAVTPQQQQLKQQHLHTGDEMDTFFDFNQGDFASPSSANSPQAKFLPSHPTFDVPSQQSEYLEQHSRQYSGPSHEYGRFRQQTGLPSGAFANMSNPQQMGFAQFPVGYNSGIGMEMDFGEGSSAAGAGFYYPGDAMEDILDPNAIDSKHLEAPQSMNRLRPGMHSKQAEAAKADAVARQQRQQQMMRQQSQQQQQQMAMQSQRPVPQMAQPQPQSQNAHDAEANQKISRLLQQMRQGSVASSAGDSSTEVDGNAGIPSAATKLRKDEDDMDEDERLLASEEGKKLSSKERRQLRNKVSARAFRSRRKEYISQLEAEVAAKTQESNDLRARNNHLFQQNKQLLQLSQTLIRHPAFNSFMDDLSRNPNLLQQFAPQQTQPQQPQPEQSRPQGNVNVGMTMMPDQPLDLSMLNIGNNAAGSNQNAPFMPNPQTQGFNFNMNPQIFAVHEIPAGPTAEELQAERASSKLEMPIIPELPILNAKEQEEPSSAGYQALKSAKQAPANQCVDADPSLALYHSDPDQTVCSPPVNIEQAAHLLEKSLSGKSCAQFELSVTRSNDKDTLMQRLDALFAPAEASSRRVGTLTGTFFRS